MKRAAELFTFELRSSSSPLVEQTWQTCSEPEPSFISVRRVSRATGLTLGAIGQIRRAERAVGMLRLGLSPLDVADQVGYADQSHLTRSLQRFVGRTPSQIATAVRRLAVVSVQDSPVRPGPY